MRLEVLSDNQGAAIYVLNRPEIYIGSSENSDIIIRSKEISKKHVKLIITDDQKCFAVDQGSTNGTYINDQRLVPGKRTEFPIYSSMRLGDKVLLTLLDKDTGQLPELPLREQFVEEKKVVIADEDKTRVISLKSLQKTKTEKVRKNRLKKLEKDLKKKKQVRSDKAILNRAIFSSLIVIALGFGAMKAWEVRKKRARGTIVGTIKETQIMIDDSLESLDENVVDVRIPRASLLSAADIGKHTEDVHCSLPDELFFCKRMPRGSRKKNGAININGQMVIYLEQAEWMKKAQELIATHAEINQKDPENAPAEKVINVDDEGVVATSPQEKPEEGPAIEVMNRIAFLSYLKTHIQSLPREYHELNLYFVFYSHTGSAMDIDSVMAIRGNQISQVNSRFTEDYFHFKKYDPYKILKKLDRFFRVY